MSDKLSMTERTRVRRKPERSHYDRHEIYQVIDNAFYGTIAFSDGKNVHAIPTAIWRENDYLYIHGSNGSRLLRALKEGIAACVSITLMDGLVLARSAVAHSMNYRSVCVYGTFSPVADDDKAKHFQYFLEHWLPGRWQYVRPPSAQELAAVTVLQIPLTEAVLKSRRGQVTDYPQDLELPVWAGIVPLGQKWLAPQQTPEQNGADLPGKSLREID
jgi:uncharacterized protein